MTRLVGVDVACPNCGRSLRVTSAMSYTVLTVDSDFRPVTLGMNPPHVGVDALPRLRVRR